MLKKIFFIIDEGVLYYRVMSFSLKNARATYQHLVNGLFKEHIGKTVEVYIDDMIIKSKRVEDHAHDIIIAFDILNRARMKLNPKKCTFRVNAGMFFGFMVSENGIEAKLGKIKAILDMQPPKKKLKKYNI